MSLASLVTPLHYATTALLLVLSKSIIHAMILLAWQRQRQAGQHPFQAHIHIFFELQAHIHIPDTLFSPPFFLLPCLCFLSCMHVWYVWTPERILKLFMHHCQWVVLLPSTNTRENGFRNLPRWCASVWPLCICMCCVMIGCRVWHQPGPTCFFFFFCMCSAGSS